jgi:hypothetical protein
MTEKKETDTISKKDHEAIVNNVVVYMSIDAAIADAKFEAEKMGKDSERFVKPLQIAKDICQRTLLGNPVAPVKKPEKSGKAEKEETTTDEESASGDE